MTSIHFGGYMPRPQVKFSGTAKPVAPPETLEERLLNSETLKELGRDLVDLQNRFAPEQLIEYKFDTNQRTVYLKITPTPGNGILVDFYDDPTYGTRAHGSIIFQRDDGKLVAQEILGNQFKLHPMDYFRVHLLNEDLT